LQELSNMSSVASRTLSKVNVCAEQVDLCGTSNECPTDMGLLLIIMYEADWSSPSPSPFCDVIFSLSTAEPFNVRLVDKQLVFNFIKIYNQKGFKLNTWNISLAEQQHTSESSIFKKLKRRWSNGSLMDRKWCGLRLCLARSQLSDTMSPNLPGRLLYRVFRSYLNTLARLALFHRSTSLRSNLSDCHNTKISVLPNAIYCKYPQSKFSWWVILIW